MKIEVENNGSRAVAVQGTNVLEVINPRTKRVIEVAEALTQNKEASLIGRGCEVREVEDDTPLTPFYTADKPPVESEPEPSDEERRAALETEADGLGVTFGPEIDTETLQARVDAAKQSGGKSEEEQLADMKARADKLGVKYAGNVGLATLTKRVEEAEKAAE